MDLRKTPVTAVTGVGEKRAEELEQLGIRTVEDLLTYFPYRYDDYRLVDLTTAEHEERVTVRGKLLTMPSIRWYGGKKSRISAKLDVDGLAVQVVWFNQAYLKSKLQIGQSLMVSGKWDRHRLQITADRTFFSGAEQEKQAGRLLPVYSISGGIKVAWLRKTIHQAFLQFGRQIEEVLPTELRERYRLMDRAQAMYRLHFPRSREEGSRARRRMAYEELFLYELKLLHWRRQTRERVKGIAHEFDTTQVKQLIERLPFSLTGAQQRVVREILDDLRAPEQMHRLLQGDVGSGKTVIAAIALYANYLSGCQGALMVPTEILAEQHMQSLRKLLEPYGVRLALLTGSLTAKERREVLGELQMGLADVVVGTHALIQEPVTFRRLGLVITDEQHRFGVKQRVRFREKGESPDVLHMTATPIPRTLAITVYGDMDVSVIDEMPAGRQPVDTYWVKSDVWPRVVQFIAKECRNHHQAYVICPLIDESEKLDLQNAQSVFEELTQTLAPVRVGLLHGKMSPAEKEEVMRRFAANDIQVLVSTTVVEVGVNVPNATVMVVYDADRFGLAQLHQLRGRVGRGGGSATCILVADPKTETGVERMRIMTETTDGFEIAQRDLELRGPGDFFGVKQSGLPDFRVADVVEDAKILETARTDAIRLISSPDFWQREEWSPLHRYLRSLDEEGQANFD
ncbi:ATP-dependent DNA helicase RecG [Polycladomyces sp. WAk]|uniref:ATP-dependent DNA helicase RecG n=1 Tax=Polycladomyces zharkentensis TaxID=2807616 RepID=A0ABS2WFG9_9BACL|nr:ATP-dependent DNA helicase RecG [Polycladomyces sp. WAk]MBN2908283.1 ATP-dependent DNA helicase RecG [Polycladomyces sp. WAk]